jgi:hypothetical protein
MIEQLYYTSSPIGLEKNTVGVQIRAASPGLSDPKNARVVALTQICVYQLPKGVFPNSARPQDSPICLTWTTIGQDRVLAHKVYAGTDALNRPGNYFVHLLAYLPTDWNAKNSISSWGASFWQWNANMLGNNQFELPSIPLHEIIATGKLSKANLKGIQKYLAMIIQGYLSLKKAERLFVAASSDQVALLVWGLTCALPDFILRDLTFSTYEREPENAKDLQVIGTCWEGTNDLPAACYQGYGIGINCYTGKHSSVLDSKAGFAWEYAQFAAQRLIEPAGFERIEAFIRTLNETGVSDMQGFSFFFDLEIRDEKAHLTPDEVTRLITTRGLARLYLPREGVKDGLIDLAVQDPRWWNLTGKNAFVTLHFWAQNDAMLKSGLESLVEWAIARICATLYQNARSSVAITCVGLLEGLVASAATPEGKGETAFRILDETFRTELGTQPWKYNRLDIREWILKQGRRVFPTTKTEIAVLGPWLEVAWQDLPEFLRLDVDSEFKLQAVSRCIQRNRSLDLRPIEIAKMAEENSLIFEDVLQRLIRDPQVQLPARNFFAELGQQGYSRKVELLDTLLNAYPSNPAFIDDLVRQANLQTWQEVQKLADLRTVRFLYECWIRPVGKQVLETYLLGPDEEADKSHLYGRKMQSVNKLLATAPGDAAFTEFVLEKANPKTVDEIRALSEDWRVKMLYDCWKNVTGRQLLETYLEQLSFDKAEVVKKLLAVAPTDVAFRDFVLDTSDLTFQEIPKVLGEHQVASYLYDRRTSAAGKKMLGTYLEGLGRQATKLKMEPLRRLLEAAGTDESFKDLIFWNIQLTPSDMQWLIDAQGPQFLYNRWNKEVGKKLLEIYVQGLKDERNVQSKLKNLNRLLEVAPSDQSKDDVLLHVELKDRREIESLIENQGIQFLNSVTKHPARQQLLETYLRSLDMPSVKQEATEKLLRQMWKGQAEISLTSLKHYLVLYLDVPGLSAAIGDVTALFGEMVGVSEIDRENIRKKIQKIAPELKSHGQRLLELAGRSEPWGEKKISAKTTAPASIAQSAPSKEAQVTTGSSNIQTDQGIGEGLWDRVRPRKPRNRREGCVWLLIIVVILSCCICGVMAWSFPNTVSAGFRMST